MKVALPGIRHDRSGFEALVRFHAQTESCFLDDIEVDMTAVDWFDADMCAAFGALLYQLGEELNAVSLAGIRPSVERILSKNGFLSSYGRQRIPDTWGTTIPYRRFDVEDQRAFAEYVESQLMRRSEIPEMSSTVLARFRQTVLEIFSNSVIHSRTKRGIFSCGQCFPNKNRLVFSVADLGIGMRENLAQILGLELSAENAIVWATSLRNTTKRGRIPGGLGLKLLCEFITINGGSIQIASDAGYWLFEKGQPHAFPLRSPFPGTVVTIEIDTSDTHTYRFKSELSPADVF